VDSLILGTMVMTSLGIIDNMETGLWNNIGYNGYDFTWDNRQHGDRVVEE